MKNRNQNSLIIKQGIIPCFKVYLRKFFGRIINFFVCSYKFHISTVCTYDDRIPNHVGSKVMDYKQEQLNSDIEEMSEYYHFKQLPHDKPLKICDIGCYYCGAAAHYLNKYPDDEVFGLDFKGIVEVNKDIITDRLHLYEGYPLETIRSFSHFDYVFFTRTATMISGVNLAKYMEVISKIADNVSFLEVLKISPLARIKLDISKISITNPVRMYSGMYIHNYPELLKKYGYNVTESKIFHASLFRQDFTDDHYFIYAKGSKEGDRSH